MKRQNEHFVLIYAKFKCTDSKVGLLLRFKKQGTRLFDHIFDGVEMIKSFTT